MDIRLNRLDLIAALVAARPLAAKADRGAIAAQRDKDTAEAAAFKMECKRLGNLSAAAIIRKAEESSRRYPYIGISLDLDSRPKSLVKILDRELASLAVTTQATFSIRDGSDLHKILTLGADS